MNKFKVGDVVKATATSKEYIYTNVENDWQGIVEEVYEIGEESYFSAETTKASLDEIESACFYALNSKHFELVEEPVKEEVP